MINRKFEHLRGKKVLLYGTGNIAVRILEQETEPIIAAILDQYKIDGYFMGKKIIEWCDIEKNMASDIIIAASDIYLSEIFKRIIYHCKYHKLTIWDSNGRNLNSLYDLEKYSAHESCYFEKNKQELQEQILAHDVISFDIFDTLVMRDVLEPLDIFDIVEKHMLKMGIEIHNFKKLRRTAELKSNGQNIYEIYRILQQLSNLSDKVVSQIIECELKCEKEHLMRRETMVDLLNFSIKNGKRVFLISDMYLNSEQLQYLLSELGIVGYEKIYVSCEYGSGKVGGLFDIYLKDVLADSYLHIGDNYRNDILPLKRTKIDTYEIKSAYEMMKISNIDSALIFANNFFERKLLGYVISKLFNDPFALYQSSGVVEIHSIKELGEYFVAPIALEYIRGVIYLCKHKEYSGVLFISRDGYLFQALYELEKRRNNELPNSYYVYTSRKLIAQQSNEGKENYLKYLSKMGIKQKVGKYLVCDLLTHGTTIKEFNSILQGNVEGYCLSLLDSVTEPTVHSLYDAGDWGETILTTVLIENFFTSPEPSVEKISTDLQPVFTEEHRDKEKIKALKKLHKYLLEYYVNEFDEECSCREYAKKMINLIRLIKIGKEIDGLNIWELKDDMDGKLVKIDMLSMG